MPKSLLIYQANLFQSVFGTSSLVITFNLGILAVCLYLVYRWLWQPLSDYVNHLISWQKLVDTPTIWLEVTPPVHTDKTPVAIAQLFATLRDVLTRDEVLSLECTASHSEGIRYLLRVKADDVEVVQHHLAAYMGAARFTQLPGSYQPEAMGNATNQRLLEFTLARHYGYPLQEHTDYSEHDLAAYMAGAMTKLQPGEAITAQLVISPHYSVWTDWLRNKLRRDGYVQLDNRMRTFIFSRWWIWVASGLFALGTHDLRAGVALALVLLGIHALKSRHAVVLSPKEEQLFDQVEAKLAQPLFQTDMRVLVTATDSQRLASLTKGIYSSLASLKVEGQALQVKQQPYSLPVMEQFSHYKLTHRLPSLLSYNTNILTASELANLYHFPYGQIRTEDLVKSLSRTLPAPVSLKARALHGGFDVVLGKNLHHGSETPLGLTADERERHVFILGGTGNGKTTTLQYAIIQDIIAGKGVAVIDPHGDLAESLLPLIPEERINDVVYFNPRDIAYPIGLNLLEKPKGLSEDDLLIELDFITESIVSVFRKIFSDDDSGGHRIEHFLRSAIHTAFTVDNATLFTVYKLFTNSKFRSSVTSKLEDDDLIDFWKGEFNTAGDYQKVKMSSGVNAKLGRFRRSVVTRRILEQPVSTIDFDDIIQNKKILICNFPKGKIGEDTSALLGTSILTKIQLAALRRSRIDQNYRTPFYLYVDEFQNMATSSFSQVLSEARKYKLFLTIAEQTTAQQQDLRLTEVILANVGTVICFRTGSSLDEELMLPLFSPSISAGELSKLEAFNFYARIMAVKAQEPLSGETIVLEDKGSKEVADNVIAASRERYAIEYKKQPKPIKQEITPPQTIKEPPKDGLGTNIASAVTPIGS